MAASIALIGALEGLQISVSSLYRKNIAELRDRYPTAARRHDRFATRNEVVGWFFAGR